MECSDIFDSALREELNIFDGNFLAGNKTKNFSDGIVWYHGGSLYAIATTIIYLKL